MKKYRSNHNELLLHNKKDIHNKKDRQEQTLMSIWRDQNSFYMLLGMQNGAVTMKNSLSVPHMVKCRITTWPSDSYGQQKWKHTSTQKLIQEYLY